MKNNQMVGIVACSGASNVGAYSDLVARKLMSDGVVRMACLAKFSIEPNFAELANSNYSKFIIIDGCSINCAEIVLNKAQIENTVHFNITDFGIIKGKTPVTEEKVNEISDYIKNNFLL